MFQSRTRTAATVLALAVLAGTGATACNRPTRWCELDRGDVLVDDSYCEAGLPGYEWEPDHDKPKHKKKPKKTGH
ncbi:hypothetical protein [Nocardia thailandica]|uniref:hypothetical protein n=1 Tax=Nocardia thailandica TaxID=257275 RepID=UPI000303D9CC|nr:hypothetical protein [Nocardia thailandica]